jgi:RimJ/RimL family protein N-acetyltransferase
MPRKSRRKEARTTQKLLPLRKCRGKEARAMPRQALARSRPQYEIRMVSRGFQLKKIGARAFADFINPFVKEKAYLSVQKKVTLPEERAWLKRTASEIDRRDLVRLLLFVDGMLAGTCDVRRGTIPNQRHNVSFGIAVLRKWRGLGFGEMLLLRGISEAKRRFKPHRMWIEHDSENKVAAQLYRKVGFVQVARLKHRTMHFGRYTDDCIMEYRGKK